MSATSASPGGTLYATAVFEAADAAGGVELLTQVGDGLSAVARAWREERSFRAYFLSSVVSGEQKHSAWQRIGQGGGGRASLPTLLTNFLRLLQKRGRLELLPEIGASYEKLLDARLGRVPVTLTTAVEIPEWALKTWIDSIRTSIGGEPVVEHVVKPEILAGAIIRVGDRVADGSARRRLAELRQKIIERGTHFHALQS